MEICIKVKKIHPAVNKYGKTMIPLDLDLNGNDWTTRVYCMEDVPPQTDIVVADLVDYKGTIKLTHVHPMVTELGQEV